MFAITLTGAVAAGFLFAPLASGQDRPGKRAESKPERPISVPSGDGGLAGGFPDVIVSNMINTSSVSNPGFVLHGTVGGIAAYSMKTVSCNTGTAEAEWFAGVNRHPVIGQAMYRIKGGRFEQIGLSWLKHGFCAADASNCGQVATPNFSCDWLGLYSTDTYTASRNGTQSTLGPRSEVNPWTGDYPYPFINTGTGGTIGKRTQIQTTDLDPALNAGALYFGEVQYVVTDEQPAQRYNNVSYRKVLVGAANGSTWTLTETDSIVRELPAINVWRVVDPQVVLANIDVPNDGRMIIGSRVTDLGGGVWHYEYALYNMNSDRAAKGLVIPLPPGVTVSNVGFRDINYHSGEPYSSVDWSPSISTILTWQTQAHSENVNANALRWGTTYNFRFDSTSPPKNAQARVDMFKPGEPAGVFVTIPGPTNCPADINDGGVGDGTVNVTDLLAVISAWGACAAPTNCPADLAPPGGDDSVNVTDLLGVISGWGSCPQ